MNIGNVSLQLRYTGNEYKLQKPTRMSELHTQSEM